MNKTLIIGNRSCPVTLQADRIIFHPDISNGIPITTEAIVTLMNTFDKIIIQLPIYINDDLVQGDCTIVNGFILHLFRIVAKEKNTKFYIQTKNDLSLMNKDSITSALAINASSMPANVASSRHSVTSVQKWETTLFYQADELAYTYYSWLSPFTKKLIKVDIQKDEARFRIGNVPYPLLVLKKVPQVSTNISEWEIKSGMLNKTTKKEKGPLGRLWFIVNDEQKPFITYSSLTHFKPALPWLIYRLTQSILHPFVMNQFKKHTIG